MFAFGEAEVVLKLMSEERRCGNTTKCGKVLATELLSPASIVAL